MNVLRYAVAGLFLFASWANHTRPFGIGGGDFVTLVLAVVGLSLLATAVFPRGRKPQRGKAEPQQPR
ncbi:MAG: hypothetical protein ABIF82_12840 [Planctomycetota bacterium]